MRPAKASARPVDLAHLDHALELAPRHEPQRGRVDEAEQAVAADREAEELGILLAAAVRSDCPRAVTSRNDSTSLMKGGMARPRPWMLAERQPPMVTRSTPVCFCAKAQLSRVGLVGRVHRHQLRLQVSEDLRPLDAGLDLEKPALAVESEHPVHLADVEHQGVGAELLPAHGVAPAGDAHRALLLARRGEQAAHRVDAGRRGDAKHPRRVELRVDVVDEDRPGRRLGGFLRGLGPRRLRPGRGERGEANEIRGA